MYPDGCAPITSDLAPDGTSFRTYETSLQVPNIACCTESACPLSAELCRANPSTTTTTRSTPRFIAPISSLLATASEFHSLADRSAHPSIHHAPRLSTFAGIAEVISSRRLPCQ